nr:hypothetical protein 1 [Pelagibacterales bacterium]
MATKALNLYQCRSPNNGAISYNKPVFPGPNSGWTTWDKGQGKYTIQGKTWDNDAKLQWANSDPTSNSWGYLKLNTGANHDCNAFWGCSPRDGTERLVRGVYFKHHTNGAKFRPRITGVALRYANPSNNQLYHFGLTYRGAYYDYDRGGTLPYEGTSTSNWWYGVAAKSGMPDGDWFHNSNLVWTGVLFHFETTWKSGGATDCIVYIKELRSIIDSNKNSTPSYNNKYRVWGAYMK